MAIELAVQRKGSEVMRHPDLLNPRPLRLVPTLALALVLRTLAAMFMFRADPRLWFYDQASELTCLAHSILSGNGLSSPFCGSTGPSAFLAPGYPLLIALVYRLFGAHSFGAAKVITATHVLVGVLTVLTVMLIASRLFDNSTAYLAGALCAISPTMIWLPMLFWETSLSTLFLSGVLLLALICVDRPTTTKWVVTGTYCALSLFVNPALLVTFAGVGFWILLSIRHTSRYAPLLAAITCAVLFSAWPIRNAVTLHAFIPLRSNLGYELWQGNRPGSQGFFIQDLYLNANHEEYDRYAAMGELPYMREKQAIAIASIKADPLRFVKLSLKRAAIFWTAMGGHGISWIVIGEITVTSLCSFAGLTLLLRRRFFGAKLLLIPFLLFPLPYYITHPDFRFRLLLEPLTLLLAAWLICRGSSRLMLLRRSIVPCS